MSAYWYYLEEAAARIPMVAAQAIADANGRSIAPGDSVDAATIKAWSTTGLPEQVEEVIALRDEFDAAKLEADMLAMHKCIPTLGVLYQPVVHNHYLKLGVALVEEYPAIAFRLCILQTCLPFEYSRTLFCLWLSVFESECSEREAADFERLFLAALCHDLGLLDLQPRFTLQDHDPRSSEGDMEGYYAHVNFSASFLMRQLKAPDKVLRSIQQHHENMDGTGYPEGTSGNKLAEFGQHIHLYDTVYSIYTKSYQPLGKSLADLKPIIEINAVTHFGQVAVRLLAILSREPRSETVFFEQDHFHKIHKETRIMAAYVESALSAIQVFTGSVGFRHEDRTLFALQNSFIHIALSYYKLRQLHKQAIFADALAVEGEYEQLSLALEDNFLALREIIFHIEKFLYRLRLFHAKHANATTAEHTEKVINILSRLNVKLLS